MDRIEKTLKRVIFTLILACSGDETKAQSLQEIVSLEAKIVEAKLRDELSKYASSTNFKKVAPEDKSSLLLPTLPPINVKPDVKVEDRGGGMKSDFAITPNLQSPMRLMAIFGMEGDLRAQLSWRGKLLLVKAGSQVEGNEVMTISSNGISLKEKVIDKQAKNLRTKETFYLLGVE